jgi:hypothetical protein
MNRQNAELRSRLSSSSGRASKSRRGGRLPPVNLMNFDSWWKSALNVEMPPESAVSTKSVIEVVEADLFRRKETRLDQDEKAQEPAKKRAKRGNVPSKTFKELLSIDVLENLNVATMLGRPAFVPNLNRASCARLSSNAALDTSTIFLRRWGVPCPHEEQGPLRRPQQRT